VSERPQYAVYIGYVHTMYMTSSYVYGVRVQSRYTVSQSIYIYSVAVKIYSVAVNIYSVAVYL
jgi:hypothetical protein